MTTFTRPRRYFKEFLCALLFLVVTSAVSAKTVYVTPAGSGNHDGLSWLNSCTLFEAIGNYGPYGGNKATYGDVVWVAQGMHTIGTSLGVLPRGSVYGGFVGNETALSQRSTNAALTTVQNGVWSIDNMYYNSPDGGKLDGLTILNSNVYTDYTGNIYNCIFDNTVLGLENSSGNNTNVYNTIFKNNTRYGVYIWPGGRGNFSDCQFFNNKQGAVQSNGAASSSSANFYRCDFHNNTSDYGGALRLTNTYSEVFNCLFYNNAATNRGGAIDAYNQQTGYVRIYNNTITNNSAPDGSGVSIDNKGNWYSEVRNSILWGNTGGNNLSSCTGCAGSPYELYFTNNIIQGTIPTASFFSQSGNSNVDPLFGANYRLLSCSPAINVGNNGYAGGGTDLGLSPRLYNGGAVDLGCYEYQGDKFSAVITANGSSSFCPGGSVTLTSSTAGSYLWSNGATTQSITVSAAGTYYVTATNADGCNAQSNSIAVTVNPVPSVGAVASVDKLCVGGSLTLIGVGAVSYSWNNGVTNGVTFVPPVGTNTYTVTGTNAQGCQDVASISVIVYPLPTFTSAVTPVTCLGGSDGTITMNALTGTAPFQYSKNNGGAYQVANIFSSLSAGIFSLRVKDANTCVSAPAPVVVDQKDQIAPVANCKNISVNLDATGNIIITASQVDNASTDNCGIASYKVVPNAFSCANIGKNTVTLYVTDVNGNTSSCTSVVTVNDVTAPVIICPAPVAVANDPGKCGAVVSYKLPIVTDNCSGAANINPIVNGSFETGDYTGWTVSSSSGSCGTWGIVSENQTLSTGQYLFDHANQTNEYQSSPGLPYTFHPTDGTKMGVFLQRCGSSHRMYQNVTLPSGNIHLKLDLQYKSHYAFSTSQFIAINLRDPNTNVVLATLFKTLPGDPQSVPMTNYTYDVSAYAGQLVRLELIEATINNNFFDVLFDNIHITGGSSLVQTAGLASGSAFPVGTTTNTFVSQDAYGNSSACSFDVTVLDKEAPKAVCKNITVALDANGLAVITAADVDGGSTDNCKISSVSIDISKFDCSDLGDNKVTLTVTDINGNASSCVAVVTVVDVTAPVVICPAPVTVANDPGKCGAVVSYKLPAVTDNCSGGANTNPIVNGSFETGDYTGWTVSSSNGPCGTWGIVSENQTLSSGQYLFDHANQTNEYQSSPGLPYTFHPTDGTKMGVFLQRCGSSHSMYQNVTLPSGNISLTLDLQYKSHYVFSTSQFIAINLRDPNTNVILATLFKTLPGDPQSVPMTSYTYDVSAYAGQLVRLELIEATINNNYFDVLFDNIHITGGSSLVQTAGLSSGSSFPVGTTTNTFEAKDANGNSSTCSFDITVVDKEAPKAVCKNITVALDTNGLAAITAADVNGGSTDNCKVSSVSIDVSKFDCSDLGDNKVTLTVTDINGNVSSCVAVVTVVDKIPPVIVCPENITITATTEDCAPSVTWIQPEIKDNCKYTVLSSHQSGDHFRPGTTTVSYTVTDSQGNSSSCTFDVTVVAMPLTASVAGINISCKGGSSGSIDLFVKGGCLPYTYKWSNGAMTEDLSGLPAGIYTVFVTDVYGTTTSANITLTEPSVLISKVYSPTFAGGYNISCNGVADGSIDLSVGGGTAPYTYLWSNGATTQDLSGLVAGVYYVTITDANGCVTYSKILLTEPALLVSKIFSPTYSGGYNISCNGAADGSIDLSVGGGTAPYTYSWSNGATTEDLSGLGAGVYYVTITDANGCVTYSKILLTEPALLVSKIFSPTFAGGYNISCNGAADGSIDLSVGGGTAPYTYSWSNGATTEDLSGLGAGVYYVTITDANGCVTYSKILLTEPALLVSKIYSPTFSGGYNISCNGAADGSIDLSVGGGTAPYTYSWSNGATTEDLSGLGAGVYYVTITDANGCVTYSKILLTEPAVLTSSVTSPTVAGGYNITCNGAADGSVDLSVSGGTAPYTYAWSNGASTEDQTGLGAGIYYVTVTDANGCTSISKILLTEPAELVVNITTSAICGIGTKVVSATANVIGGTPSYSYLWNDPAAQTTATAANLINGTYIVVVLDQNNCSATATATINVKPLSVKAAHDVNICLGETVDLGGIPTATGGTTPYSYSWSPASGLSCSDCANPVVSPSATTTYIVVVTDANGCEATDTVTVTLTGKVLVCEYKKGVYTTTCVPSNKVNSIVANGGYIGACQSAAKTDGTEADQEITAASGIVSSQLIAYPNPFFDKTQVDFSFEENNNVVLSVYNMSGQLVQTLYNGTADAGKIYQMEINGSDLSNGVYFVTLQSDRAIQRLRLILNK